MNDPLFTFDEKGHQYKYDGKPVTGVTSVIGVLAKPALIGWAAKVAVEHIRQEAQAPEGLENKVWMVADETLEEAKSAHTKKKEAAGTHGTDAHAAVEIWIGECIRTNQGRPISLKAIEIERFCEWAIENVDHFLFSERRMFNKDLFIAGTCDFAYIDKQGRRVVSDFKTSGSGVYYEMWIQTAAYQLLAEAEGDEKYDYRTIVRLDKRGGFEVQRREDFETDKDAFLCALKLYRAMATYKKV